MVFWQWIRDGEGVAEMRPRAGLLAGKESTAGGGVVVGDGGAGMKGRNKVAGVYGGVSLT